MKRDFISLLDWSSREIRETLELAKELKRLNLKGECPQYLNGKSYAMIFHKDSLRTRVSFEVGIKQMGGHCVHLTDKDFVMGKREPVADVAQVLSRYVDGILIRTFGHQEVVRLGQVASVPVINMLTDWLHPCQIMADIMTIEEHRGSSERARVVYLGDGNNVTNSWINMAARLPLDLWVVTSPETLPDMELVENARKEGLSNIHVVHSWDEAVKNADVLYTDVWASMGEKEKINERVQMLQGFQINQDMVNHSKKNVMVMHCLPAERGHEITAEVLDGPNSVVFDQAENRLHAQKAIMVQLEKWRTAG
ncbi:MAG: ornithine carbamoyltransferase [SAR324 cluster bacterium]|nr:ornithine carbamoyltransferase [SAR324 cluster bacterium]